MGCLVASRDNPIVANNPQKVKRNTTPEVCPKVCAAEAAAGAEGSVAVRQKPGAITPGRFEGEKMYLNVTTKQVRICIRIKKGVVTVQSDALHEES